MTETRVLVVDDDEDMRDLLRATIEVANGGLSVSGVAEDGDDALAQWREQRPEVVLLDQRMPRMSGLEVAQRILAECPDQKIILFTAYLDDTTEAAAERFGITACMSKRDIRRLPQVLRDQAESA
jgi:two-component system, chemotaxis family, chemotaxis protein CheY